MEEEYNQSQVLSLLPTTRRFMRNQNLHQRHMNDTFTSSLWFAKAIRTSQTFYDLSKDGILITGMCDLGHTHSYLVSQ